MEEVKEKREARYIDKVVQFFKEVKQEIDRVTWPGRDEIKGATVVVIIVVIAIGFFIGLVDKLLSIFNDFILF